jgi:hypothetical protein
MAFPPITELPEAPIRGDVPATFATKANAFVAALPQFRTDVNAAGSYIDGAVAAAELAETNAELAETNAETAQGLAEAAQLAAESAATNAAADVAVELAGYVTDTENAREVALASANFKGTWSSLSGALNKPASVLHSGRFWQLLNNLADVTASEPGVTADWAQIGIEEAPEDGKQYTRKDATWEEVSVVGGLTPLTASATLAVNTIYSVDANGDFTFTIPAGTANGDTIKVKRNGFGGNNVFTGAFRNGEAAIIAKSWNYTLDLTWSATRSLWVYE